MTAALVKFSSRAYRLAASRLVWNGRAPRVCVSGTAGRAISHFTGVNVLLAAAEKHQDAAVLLRWFARLPFVSILFDAFGVKGVADRA